MRPIKYLAFNGKELVQVISLDSMKDGEPIVLVSEDGSGDLPMKNLGKVPVYEWTGKVDKNGVEIYDGAIIEFNLEEWGGADNIHIVSWDDTDACWSWGGGSTGDMEFRKIIGHISTNPELLK